MERCSTCRGPIQQKVAIAPDLHVEARDECPACIAGRASPDSPRYWPNLFVDTGNPVRVVRHQPTVRGARCLECSREGEQIKACPRCYATSTILACLVCGQRVVAPRSEYHTHTFSHVLAWHQREERGRRRSGHSTATTG